MGRVVLRAIEVKRNNEWQIFPFITTKKEHFDYEVDDYIPSKKIGDYYQDYVEEASLRLRDQVFGYGCDNELKKPLPNDMSEEIKKIVPNHAYCINVKDWSEFISTKEAEFKHKVENLYNLKNFKEIHKKLDCILKHEEYKEPTEEEKYDEIEDIGYMEDDIWVEDFYLLFAMQSEYDHIYDLLYSTFEDWPETRIYYWID